MAFLLPPPPLPPLFPATGSASPNHGASPSLIPSRRRRCSSAFSFPNPLDPKKRAILFDRVQVIGRRKLPQHVIDHQFDPLIGNRVVMQDVHNAIAAINKWLQDHEYACSQIVLAKIPAFINRQITLFSIEPSLSELRLLPVDKDGKEDPKGVIKTRKGTILNAIGMQVGDVFVWRSTGFARLMALGLFDFANAEVKVLSNDQVELILRLRERPAGRIEPGAGIASDGRVYGDISIIDNNVMGRGQRMRVEWQKRLDVNRSAGGVAFEDKRLGSRIPLSFRMRAYRDCNSARGIPGGSVPRAVASEREGAEANVMGTDTPLRYEKDRDGLLFDVGYRPIGSSTMFNFTPMVEHIHSSASDPSSTSSLQAILQTGFTHATRVPTELPRDGHIFRIEQFLGTPLRAAFDPFYKINMQLSKYAAFGPRASLALNSTMGAGTGNLPWHEQKSLGGQRSVRGYEYGELGRYTTFATGRLELRVPLAFSKAEVVDPAAAAAVPADGAVERKGLGKSVPSKVGTGQSMMAANGIPETAAEPDTPLSKKVLARLPPLVGVLFGDVAAVDTGNRELSGASYGLGMRIGGVVAAEWTSTADGRRSRLHFSLIDHAF